jgi:hypothetical protein
MINLDAEMRHWNRRAARENRTPQVVYSWGGAYGLARLANIRDYLMLHYPPDYSTARVITDPADLKAIAEAEVGIRAARKAADRVYARAFQRGVAVTAEAAEAAAREVER